MSIQKMKNGVLPGFLCFGDAEARGNLGLLDQYLAMRWVQENINKFGGDVNKVTVMGHSSGAASIMYHLVSPRTKRKFITSDRILPKLKHINLGRELHVAYRIPALQEALMLFACSRKTSFHFYNACGVSFLQRKKLFEIQHASGPSIRPF